MRSISESKKLPVVSIIGRPNVGKSTLFNRIIKRKRVIVSSHPGTTRDVLEEIVSDGTPFVLRDTGGYLPESGEIGEKVLEKLRESVNSSDLLILVFDGKEGVTSLDLSLLDIVRKSGKRYVAVVNKMDSKEARQNIAEFYSVVDSFIPISAEHGHGVFELVEQVLRNLPESESLEESPSPEIKVAIVGRPNVGKSMLLNRIVGYERVIVSEVPGTTRDTVDTMVEKNGRSYLFLDTAGIRKKRSSCSSIEKIGISRTLKAIEGSDITLLIVDASSGITDGDKKIARLILDKQKGFGVVVNKWDLVNPRLSRLFDSIVRDELHFLGSFPYVTVSALTGRRVGRIFDVIEKAYSSYSKRVKTSEINRFVKFLSSGATKVPPQGFPKIYYAAQVDVKPPTFVMFVKSVDIPDAVKKFIEKRIREFFEFEGTPIRVLFRSSR